MTSILLAGDRVLLLQAVGVALERDGFQVLGVVDAPAMNTASTRARPDLVILDVESPNDLVLGQELYRSHGRPLVVAMVPGGDYELPGGGAARTFLAGFISKDLPVSGFLRAVRDFVVGRAPSPNRRHDQGPAATQGSLLTPREHDVLEMLARGATSDMIASALGIRLTTARTHIQSILTKLQVHSRLEAVAVAERHGLVRSLRSA